MPPLHQPNGAMRNSFIVLAAAGLWSAVAFAQAPPGPPGQLPPELMQRDLQMAELATEASLRGPVTPIPLHNGTRIGVCAVQAGPGAENAFAGVAQAASESTPILVLPGGTRRARRGVPYTFQAPENYRALVKWVDEINQPERIPEMMRRAFHALRNGRRGPTAGEPASARGYLRRIFSIALPLASTSMSLSR